MKLTVAPPPERKGSMTPSAHIHQADVIAGLRGPSAAATGRDLSSHVALEAAGQTDLLAGVK